jgi:hypothetical protein
MIWHPIADCGSFRGRFSIVLAEAIGGPVRQVDRGELAVLARVGTAKIAPGRLALATGLPSRGCHVCAETRRPLGRVFRFAKQHRGCFADTSRAISAVHRPPRSLDQPSAAGNLVIPSKDPENRAEAPMSLSLEALWKMSDVELLAAYHDVRRQHAEKKFARDTQRARLEWQRAKAFAASSGGVSERRNAVEASEELGRKGQELRELTRDLDLLRTDVDLIAMMVRLRGAFAPTDVRIEEPRDSENREEGA